MKDNQAVNAKKNLVERIAAELHTLPGVLVERNVRIPSKISPNTKREIDVLLTVNPVGYEMRIPIECKNVSDPIEAEDIDAFVGKLGQVGIASQGGIYVSTSDYRSGALHRVQEAGIVPLRLEGLAGDRLSIAPSEAVQSIIYLLPIVQRLQWVSNAIYDDTDIRRQVESHKLYDAEGNWTGWLLDLVWEEWRYRGNPPSVIGQSEVKLSIPQGWHQVVHGQKEPIKSATAQVLVKGCVVIIPGTVSSISLTDVIRQRLEKWQISGRFESEGRYPVLLVSSEGELDNYLKEPRQCHIVIGRLRMPRLLAQGGYWPPSEKAAGKIAVEMEAFIRGERSDPRPFSLADIEGQDLTAIFEKPFVELPVVQRNLNRKGATN